jgi:hypothetical protein
MGLCAVEQGCQIYLGPTFQNGQNIRNYRKIYQMAVNIPTLSITRPSKIYPNWDFWFENIPSGNPVLERTRNLFIFKLFYHHFSAEPQIGDFV